MEVAVSSIPLLIVDIAHHFIFYVADALHVLCGAADIGECEV